MKTQFAIPEPGSSVAVTFEFPSYVLGASKVNQTTITGIVEKATTLTPPNYIRIVTDTDSPVRIREVPLHRITNITYADGSVANTREATDDTQTWVVDGSRGSKYTVVHSNNTWSCTCPGFQYRKTCKHVQEIQNA